MSLSCHLPHPQGQRPEQRDAVWAEPRQRAVCWGDAQHVSRSPRPSDCLLPWTRALCPGWEGPSEALVSARLPPLNSCSLV